MNAEQYAEELPALHYNGLIDDTDIQAICEMLRRLAAVEAELERIKVLEPVAWAFKHADGSINDPSTTEHSVGMIGLYALGSKTND